MAHATAEIPAVLDEVKKLLDQGEDVLAANRRLLREIGTQAGPAVLPPPHPPRPGYDVSVVVPIYNERESIRPLRQELVKVLDALPCGRAYEIVFVDDGSTDGSFSVLEDLHAEFPYVRVVRMRSNFGKSAALQAGFEAARGEVIITIDGDLQDDPAEIPRLLEALENGNDLVSGWKMNRCDPWTKTVPSRIFNRAVSLATGVKLRDCNCGFKAYRRQVVEEIVLYGELHRFVPALARARGFRVKEIPVHHRPRRFGHSKFGAGRLLRGFLDFLTTLAVTKFHRRPLHLFGVTGLTLLSAGLAINGYLTLLWLRGRWIGHRPLLLLGVLLTIVGIQVVFFGLLADLSLFSRRRRDPPPVRDRLE